MATVSKAMKRTSLCSCSSWDLLPKSFPPRGESRCSTPPCPNPSGILAGAAGGTPGGPTARPPAGYLGLAPRGGGAGCEGVRCTVSYRRSTSAMTANDVETIYVSRDGSLWIGIYGGTLLRYQNGRFRSYSSRE